MRRVLDREGPVSAHTNIVDKIYHKNVSPVGAKEEEVARAYPKRAERIDELNGQLRCFQQTYKKFLKSFSLPNTSIVLVKL